MPNGKKKKKSLSCDHHQKNLRDSIISVRRSLLPFSNGLVSPVLETSYNWNRTVGTHLSPALLQLLFVVVVFCVSGGTGI